jgi:hypothetical protein
MGIVLGHAARGRERRIDGAAYERGWATGDRASFGRPVGQGGPLLIGKN